MTSLSRRVPPNGRSHWNANRAGDTWCRPREDRRGGNVEGPAPERFKWYWFETQR